MMKKREFLSERQRERVSEMERKITDALRKINLSFSRFLLPSNVLRMERIWKKNNSVFLLPYTHLVNSFTITFAIYFCLLVLMLTLMLVVPAKRETFFSHSTMVLSLRGMSENCTYQVYFSCPYDITSLLVCDVHRTDYCL